ncbi:MAG: hypothetical protein IJV48_08420 [Ruminococcus sp.]|nr:hypothetical protein [Ruminococcus sp.]
MSYQRVTWHSGLTYRAVCPNCRAYTTYTDYHLGFRMWYPDGFVYCARCKHPIRHHENNAINPDGSPYFPFPIRTPPPPGYVAYPIESLRVYPEYPNPQPNGAQPASPNPSEGQEKRFCHICGREYIRGQAKFCAGCGTPLTDV